MEAAAKDPAVAKMYVNGFVNSLGSGDTAILLKQNDQPVALLNMSYTMAKTLAQKLTGLIEALEKGMKTQIMTTDDINQMRAGGNGSDEQL